MKRGLQKKLAEETGYSEQYISFILNGKRTNISTECAKRLSEASFNLGLCLTPEDWAFRATIIKERFRSGNGETDGERNKPCLQGTRRDGEGDRANDGQDRSEQE